MEPYTGETAPGESMPLVDPPPLARLQWRRTPAGTLVVMMSGSVATETIDWLATTIESFHHADLDLVVLDLSRVAFFDARGVSLLVRVQRWFERHGVDLAVVPNDLVGLVLEQVPVDVPVLRSPVPDWLTQPLVSATADHDPRVI